MSFCLRPARASDVAGMAACVEAAYSPYVERIGRKPGPMVEDYSKIIEERQVTVADPGLPATGESGARSSIAFSSGVDRDCSAGCRRVLAPLRRLLPKDYLVDGCTERHHIGV